MSFAAATGHALTTEAAESVLRDGGTAVDACIAAAFTAFVVEPILASPLGGGFLMVAPAHGPVGLLDAFVDTPRRKAREADLDLDTITVDFGSTRQDFHIGAGTIANPCLIPALFEAHDRLGRVPIRELVAPAVALARNGHVVTDFQSQVMSLIAPILAQSDHLKGLYFDDGKPIPAGKALKNPALGDVLEVTALEGPRFFTEGEVAHALLDLPGSHLSSDDLRRAAPVFRQAIQIKRNDSKIWLNPAPSLGGAQVALALSSLPQQPSCALVAKCLAEIGKIRSDVALDKHPEAAENLMLDPVRVARLATLLAEHKTASRGTTHISAIDAKGNGAALTLSNGEGCGRMLAGTGLHPNNMLGEEDLSPDGPLGWQTGRRLASMMCPMVMRGRNLELTLLGSGGSNRIRSALTQVAVRLTDDNASLSDAVDGARLHVEGQHLSFEDTGGEQFRESLLKDWPEAAIFPDRHMFFGGVHAVRGHPTRGVDAAGDPRRSGTVSINQ